MRHLSRFSGTPAAAAHAALVARVFAVPPQRAPAWCPFGLFDETGACRAAAEARALPLDVGGRIHRAGAIRRVGVDAPWRGRGLMRAVMGDVLAWCEREALSPVLLFTERPALYASLGFASVPQHAFVGPPPERIARRAPARPLDLAAAPDRARLADLLARRAPVSARGGLAGAPDLVAAVLEAAADLACYDMGEGLVVIDREATDLVLVDIIAPRVPPMAEILGALATTPREITTLFAPDRLGWAGVPRAEPNGLMARGALPAELAAPFMLPPTAEF